MVEVKEFSSATAEDLYKAGGLEYNPEVSKAIAALDGENTLGTCLYDITDSSITIRFLNPSTDFTMADSMLRSALFIAANRGIMEAYFLEPVKAELIKRLGFLGNEANKTIDITNLFNPCGCKK